MFLALFFLVFFLLFNNFTNLISYKEMPKKKSEVNNTVFSAAVAEVGAELFPTYKII